MYVLQRLIEKYRFQADLICLDSLFKKQEAAILSKISRKVNEERKEWG